MVVPVVKGVNATDSSFDEFLAKVCCVENRRIPSSNYSDISDFSHLRSLTMLR